MNESIKHDDNSPSPEASHAPPKDTHRKATPQIDLLPCRLCGSCAELWQRWLRDDVWESYGSCTNEKDVDGEPCQFYVPEWPGFYFDRRAAAARYWNVIMGPRPAVDGPVPVTDGFQETLRVEIFSDTPHEVEQFRKQLCDLILDAPVGINHDVMVTIYRGDTIPVYETNRRATPCHPDPTGKTREPPHCPTCSCHTAGEIPVVI